MNESWMFWASAVALGMGATAVMDLCAAVLRRATGLAPPDYAMVGRWLAHMPRGTFRHPAIARAPAVPGERAAGWVAHYLIGVAFAAVLLEVWGREWLLAPTPGAPLAVALGTLAAPFLLMQPAMGAGVFASRAPRPAVARARSLLTHLQFGFGLYVAGVALRFLSPILSR